MTPKQIDKLRPFLEGSGPGEDGEWGLRCPLHDDTKRSASINVSSGLWYCQACEEGGRVATLLRKMKELGVEVEGTSGSSEAGGRPVGEEFPFNDNHVRSWQAALAAESARLKDFCDRRGLGAETLDEFEVGWRDHDQAFTIPVRDSEGELVSVRFYQLDPPEGRRKIWGVRGFNSPLLYPIDALIEPDPIIICEGEWDAMILWQYGFNAITRTAAADVWNIEWNKLFSGREVYLCHDADTKGQKANNKIEKLLRSVAAAIYTIVLPYEVGDKHGKDISDFFLDGYDDEDLQKLMDQAKESGPPVQADRGVVDVRVMDSLGADHFGERMRMRVTVTGKRNPPYMLPKDVTFNCTMDAGAKCKFCPMQDAMGNMNRVVTSQDDVLLSMMNSTEAQVRTMLRERNSIQKCGKLEITVNEFQPVEELYVRPSIDTKITSQDSGDYTSRRVYSTASHDTKTNSTIELVGTVHPSPKNQMNEFMAWEAGEVDTDIDKFEMTAEMGERLKIFQSSDPLYGLDVIADDLSANITKIYGRTQMHVFMDLVYHSVLGFNFLGETITKGWLDGLVLGDTRTGKSWVADQLRHHYGLGEMITCESASFAGIVGGVQQFSTNVWDVSWGTIPLNDRRAVIMDEVSGMTTDEIAQMSSIRSSGEAQITKIKAERTLARTRLLWIGNPRNAKMTDFTFGVYAIKPLVGNNEDVARFDMVMSVMSDEVDPEAINTQDHRRVPHVYTSELCNALLLWCWSRTPEQVTWSRGAEQSVLDYALKLAHEYMEDPPLIQGANVRVKLARIAAAIAARLFSTDNKFQKVIVRRSHVEAAYEFLCTLYNTDRFGYLQVSKELKNDVIIAEGHIAEAESWAWSNPNAAKLMKTRPSFRRSDLEDVLNVSREEANGIVNKMWDWRMIRRDGPDNIPTQTFQSILREVIT